MDGVPDKDDSMPLKKGELKPFGTVEYENEVNSKAETLYNDSLDSGTTPDSQTLKYDLPTEYLNVNDMVSLKQTILKFGKEKALSRAAIGIMMEDVNKCEEYLQYISDEDWLKFCAFFNKHVNTFDVVYEDLHYFRNKLNRTPSSFQELIDNKSNWILYTKRSSRYHMNNGIFASSNPNYKSYFSYKNEYNMKFVDKYGLNEVIVSPKDDIGNMTHNEIYDYLTKAENWVILTEDYNNTDPNFRYDPVNMGTYNYCAYDKKIPGHDSSKEYKKHKKLDIYPFNDCGNVKGLKYGTTDKEAEYNDTFYNENANNNVYKYWGNLFEKD